MFIYIYIDRVWVARSGWGPFNGPGWARKVDKALSYVLFTELINSSHPLGNPIYTLRSCGSNPESATTQPTHMDTFFSHARPSDPAAQTLVNGKRILRQNLIFKGHFRLHPLICLVGSERRTEILNSSPAAVPHHTHYYRLGNSSRSRAIRIDISFLWNSLWQIRLK